MSEMVPQLIWLIVIGLCCVASLLSRIPWVRRQAVAVGQRFGPRIVAWLNPPPEIDPLAAELRHALRREQLLADVRRLERLLVTDMGMSATRQIGNRLAYDWLVRELTEVTEALSTLFLTDQVRTSRDLFEPPSLNWNVGRNAAVQHAPKVEVLEIGWKH